MNKGETIHPSPGESITCVRSGRDGGPFIFDMILGPGVSGPPTHTHDEGDEIIEVTEGEIVFVVDGRAQAMKAGDRATITPAMAHTFHNPSKTTPVHCRVTHGGRFERAVSQPGFTQLAMVLSTIDPGASRMRSPLVRAVLHLIAFFGRLRGLQPVP